MYEEAYYDPSEALNRIAGIINAQAEVASYNEDLERYVNGALINQLASAGIRIKDGMIAGNDIMRAASIYNHNVREKFAERAADLINDLQSRGYDVRMNMQNYKLVWKGVKHNA